MGTACASPLSGGRLRNKIFLLCYIGIALWACHASAQQLSVKNKKAIALYKEAERYRVTGRLSKAIPLLQQAIKKDDRFVEAYFALGMAHKYMRLFSPSTDALLSGLDVCTSPSLKSKMWLEVSDNYLRQGKYRPSLNYVERYLADVDRDARDAQRAKRLRENAEYGLAHRRDWPAYRPRLLPATVNRFALQYFPTLTADEQELIYTRRESGHPHADEDLVISKKDAKGLWTAPVSLSPRINSTENEGTCTISADGRLLIFTSCAGRPGYGSCDLFLSRKEGDVWSAPVNLGPSVNTGAWESQPTLSADGSTLYFASEREEGRGGKDIYVSYRQGDGSWSQAANLGPSINTPYDEISPFIHANGQTLFFASNGRPGFGGHDIYQSERDHDRWGEAVNFGSLINDYEDQFSLFITADGAKAYYSYEKGAYRNVSKLVTITLPEALRIRRKSNVVKGVVRDKDTGLPLAASIELFDLKRRKRVSAVASDSLTGRYLITLTQGAEYALYANASGYLFAGLHFDYEDESKGSVLLVKDIYLEKERVGGKTLLSNVFFQLDQYTLSDRSLVELDKVAAYMRAHPNLRVEIGGHTDNLGEESYNLQLSLKRAETVAVYLAGQGIESGRLAQRGYGSKRPIAPNDSEENRKKNRRIEFTLIGR